MVYIAIPIVGVTVVGAASYVVGGTYYLAQNISAQARRPCKHTYYPYHPLTPYLWGKTATPSTSKGSWIALGTFAVAFLVQKRFVYPRLANMVLEGSADPKTGKIVTLQHFARSFGPSFGAFYLNGLSSAAIAGAVKPSFDDFGKFSPPAKSDR
mmetsp:Transcript_23479/g.45864  ORF Transcript_23479/g.45864 Transcript_23479/m.45864 type:complete len:154 (+) Transcript_23479:53-514(+)